MRSDTTVRQLFLSTSGLDSYSVSFPVYAASELLVKVQSGTASERTLALGTDYAVSNMSSSGGATVTLLQSVGSGSTVCVMSMLPYAQELSLASAAAIRPPTMEKQLDRTTQQIQQLAQSLARKVGIADTSSGTVPTTDWFESQVSSASGYASVASGYAASAATTVSGFDDYASSAGSGIIASADSAVSAYAASACNTVSAYASSAMDYIGSSGALIVSSASSYASAASGYADVASGAASLVSTVWAEMKQGVVTASAVISAGSDISLPSGMSYIVGREHLTVAVGGMVADPSAVTESGTSGLASDRFSLNFAVASGQKIHVTVGSLGAMPSMSGQSGKVLTNDGSMPAWNDIRTLPSPSGQSGKYLTNDGESSYWGMLDVSGSIASHNENASAHSDIRATLSGKTDSAFVSAYVSSATSGLSSTAYVSSYVSSATSGLTSSSYVSSYVSGAVSGKVDSAYVASAVSAHDASASAHSDIRTALSAVLPAQSGQGGKYLGTDGSSASWNSVDALPSQSGQSGKFLTTDGSAASWTHLVSTVTDTSSTLIALQTASANTNYTYGTLTSLAVGFASSGAANDEIHIMWKSGTTATTLTVDGTNALFSSFTPNASSVVEIDARYYAPLAKWIVLFSQVAVS